MINALFIGGPADGRRMQVEDHHHRITIPEMPDFGAMLAMSTPPDVIPTFSETEYVRHDFLGLPGIAVFTVGGMATINILEYLIDGYKQEKRSDAE